MTRSYPSLSFPGSHHPLIVAVAPSVSPGPTSAPDLGAAVEGGGNKKPGPLKEEDAIDPPSLNRAIHANTMVTNLSSQSPSPPHFSQHPAQVAESMSVPPGAACSWVIISISSASSGVRSSGEHLSEMVLWSHERQVRFKRDLQGSRWKLSDGLRVGIYIACSREDAAAVDIENDKSFCAFEIDVRHIIPPEQQTASLPAPPPLGLPRYCAK
ncbi:hypothetical protein EDB84DRAFT_1442293 [Lactarius hengduanensis]|nr:hypothetical protein EDB84DRAFT_1442293 [Lactarius hengduanensis]